MTTTTAATDAPEFAGLPIEGNIIYGDEQEDQRPIEEFVERMQAVLAFDDVKEIHWPQYTPYFNDGEACTFSTGEVTLTLHSIPDPDGGAYERGYSPYSPQIKGGYARVYDSTTRSYVNVGEEIPQHPAYEAFQAFASGFGPHQVDLLKSFGDHAEVHVSRTGIKVDHFDHE